MNTNNDVLANRNNYEDANKYYYYRECVPVTNNECAMLRLFDSHNDGGTFYIVSWDGNEIINTKQSDAIDKVQIGDCSITSCPQNHNLFELDIITDNWPWHFS